MTEKTFIIVGASLAGAKAAEELRQAGFDGRLILIGSEPERPYERPPLTKDYLRGESAREKTYVHAKGFYEHHAIELMTGATVTAITPERPSVTLDSGLELHYDKLLLATGAEPRRLTAAGAELDGIHYLRALADADALRERLDAGGHVVVIGGGLIGSEFAASARQRGLEVTLIDPHPLPGERLFGPEIGGFFREVHLQHGVELRFGQGVVAFEGDRAIARVVTSVGETVECDFVVIGVGVVPRVGLAHDAGIAIDNGITVDEGLRTSLGGVFAAGDVANSWHPFYERRLRVEHWANALHQGPAAARAMLGELVSYDRIPYFFSDQYEIGMEYSGYAVDSDEVVFRGDPASGEFVAFWLRDGCVAAAMNVNIWDVNQHAQALIRSRRPVSSAELADPSTALEMLAAEVEA